MSPTSTLVIVGAGLGGVRSAEAARDHGYDGDVILLGAESHLPYDRPPLSKEYLGGKSDQSAITLHPSTWYDERNIELRLGTSVTRVDRAEHRLTLSDGTALPYDKLVLATGSRPRTLPLPGADAEGVLYLRTLDDSDRLKATFTSSGRIAMIGAGWIGMEAASNARGYGVDVTVVESAELPLLAALGPELARVFADLHVEHGVDFRFKTGVEAIEVSDGAVSGIRLGDGATVPADAVIIGVGAIPNLGLAEEAGLDVDGGVLVDEQLQSSDADIAAVGDIAAHRHPSLGRRIRVEHWANALNQPDSAVASLLGTPTPYDELPFFYTDQYDLGMEYHGYVDPGSDPTVVIRGDRDGREFVAFWLDGDGRTQAGMNVNVWDVGDDIKALIRSRRPVDPVKLADESVPLTPDSLAT
jgi:3-phenylpropionate/trans-cinnamate dioxygenase ferredoxin reductase subunit